MWDMMTALGVLFVVVVLPLVIILHYITRWKESKGLSREDEQMLADLWQDTKRMESRINALETILDDEVPEWRRRV
jgi:phage shock protein B